MSNGKIGKTCSEKRSELESRIGEKINELENKIAKLSVEIKDLTDAVNK